MATYTSTHTGAEIDAGITKTETLSGTNTGDQTISDATITTTDITTNDFTTAKHGFVPKGTNVGDFLKDDGTWGTVTSGSTPEGTAVLSTGETGAAKYLREDGDGTCSWQTPSGAGDVVGPSSAVDSNFASFDTTTGKLIKDSGSIAADFASALGADDNYVTDAEKTVVGNTSGTNTGDNSANTTYADRVNSDTAGVTGADQITNMMSLTQTEYDAITPNATTFYVIVG